jgi:hypothetical protein
LLEDIVCVLADSRTADEVSIAVVRKVIRPYALLQTKGQGDKSRFCKSLHITCRSATEIVVREKDILFSIIFPFSFFVIERSFGNDNILQPKPKL